MKVLVCGGRDYQDRQAVWDALLELHPTEVVHGGCPTGADKFADEWCRPVVPVTVYYADWKNHGRAAGPIRNQTMLDDSKPDLVLAFPGGRGTADMVRRALKAGVKVQHCSSSEANQEQKT